MIFDDVPEAAKETVLRASIQRLLDEAKGIDTGIVVPYVKVSADRDSFERWVADDLWMRKNTPPVGYFRCNGIPPYSECPGWPCNRGGRTRAVVLFVRQAAEPFARTLASQKWYPEIWADVRRVESLTGALHIAADGAVVRFSWDPNTYSYIASPLEGDPIDAFLDQVNSAEGNRDWLIFKYADPTQGMFEAMQWPSILIQESYSRALLDLCLRLGRIHMEGDRLHQPTDKLKPIIEAAKSDLTGGVSLSGDARRRAGRAALVRLFDSFSLFGFRDKCGVVQAHYRHCGLWWREFYQIAADVDGPDDALSVVKTWLMELGVKDRWPEIQSRTGDTAPLIS
ncbi:MAG: hypothetical protein KIT79_00960 [Deltaproteobacteria bacterium]|nr:hypothetical protein [Deltaproteobacteria bacterium]